jgi:response regulator RpfG family c-di-GMP phosphodiesterase
MENKLQECEPRWLNAYEILSSLEKAIEMGLSDYLKKYIDLDKVKANIELKKKYNILKEELSSSTDVKRKEEITKEMEEISNAERKGKFGDKEIYSYSGLKEKGLEIWYKKKQT